LLEADEAGDFMATNKRTLEALKNLSQKLKDLDVKSEDLKILNWHIGQQSKQIAWERNKRTGRWFYHPKKS
jgi:hypothetical protein